ncbi:hypothetical protein LR48_Vigan687s000200 [Vigna angularis]|uniref:Uncharacterized protein n=1 Tax=Phaseolus angularis TaxID=3914 RepID=A0A0L9TG64_PHAAN|nr:hypothetical protein LR48_Vigan687s000200 [Vigna angularis]
MAVFELMSWLKHNGGSKLWQPTPTTLGEDHYEGESRADIAVELQWRKVNFDYPHLRPLEKITTRVLKLGKSEKEENKGFRAKSKCEREYLIFTLIDQRKWRHANSGSQRL